MSLSAADSHCSLIKIRIHSLLRFLLWFRFVSHEMGSVGVYFTFYSDMYFYFFSPSSLHV